MVTTRSCEQAPLAAGPPWRAIQVRYYDTGKDTLILDAVRPLFRRLGPACQPYFLCGWRRGPHLALTMRADEDIWEAEVKPTATDMISRYLREHPSRAIPDQLAEAAMHRRLAAEEDERRPLGPWYPDNSLQFEPYDARIHVVGSAAMAGLLADFHADTTELAFAVLERVRQGATSRLLAAADLMIALGAFMSYRSHSESFLANTSDPATMRAMFDERYQRHRALLLTRLAEVRAAVDGPLASAAPLDRAVKFAGQWRATLDLWRERARPLFDEGNFRFPRSQDGRADSLMRQPSELLEAMLANEAYCSEVFGSTAFQLHRLVVNLLYLFLTRLGVHPVNRNLLGHMIANAADELSGTTALDTVRAFRSHAGGTVKVG